ncbi:hypothetical protein K438DRAFT_1851934 [Mycena galopus ATCC 62051]|nr:hypothetical protein K438DRAFT_1851934 [Mycena galopus ATCC 62051]
MYPHSESTPRSVRPSSVATYGAGHYVVEGHPVDRIPCELQGPISDIGLSRTGSRPLSIDITYTNRVVQGLSQLLSTAFLSQKSFYRGGNGLVWS